MSKSKPTDSAANLVFSNFNNFPFLPTSCAILAALVLWVIFILPEPKFNKNEGVKESSSSFANTDLPLNS